MLRFDSVGPNSVITTIPVNISVQDNQEVSQTQESEPCKNVNQRMVPGKYGATLTHTSLELLVSVPFFTTFITLVDLPLQETSNSLFSPLILEILIPQSCAICVKADILSVLAAPITVQFSAVDGL